MIKRVVFFREELSKRIGGIQLFANGFTYGNLGATQLTKENRRDDVEFGVPTLKGNITVLCH